MSDDTDKSALLYAALAAAQGAFTPISKNREGSNNGQVFKYADLDELILHTRPALSEHGLAVIQPMQSTNSGQELETLLLHSSGAFIRSCVQLDQGFNSAQNFGAYLSLMRRYAYQAILCISADDDLDATGTQVDRPRSKKVDMPDGPLFFDEKEFSAGYPDWATAVAAGKTTPDSVIKKLESIARLTDEQRRLILALEVQSA